MKCWFKRKEPEREQEYWFAPKEDITPYEVAQLLARMPPGGLLCCKDIYDRTDSRLQRHFVEKK